MSPTSLSSHSSHKRRARRVVGVIGAVVGTTVTFVTATAAATVIHLDVPVTRRLVATQINKILHDQFAGNVAIEQIGGLSLRGIEGVSGRVREPKGQQVLHVEGVYIRVRTVDLLRSVLFDNGDIHVPVDRASIGHLDAAIDGDATGNLEIANAFAERYPTPAKPTDPNARGFRVEAPHIVLQHAWIHGQAPGAPPLDAELHGLKAHAHYDPKLTSAALDSVGLVARGLPRGVDPRGQITGTFSTPSATGKDMGVEASFEGEIARIPTRARARMDGPRIDAVVNGRDVAGHGIRAMVGEVDIQDDVMLHAEVHGELPRMAAKAHVSLGKGTVDVDGDVDLSDGTTADASIVVRHVDAHAVVANLPVSDVSLDTHVRAVVSKDGTIKGDVTLATLPGSMAGEHLPLLNAKGEFTKESAHAIGQITDPRATANFEVGLNTVGANKVVEGQLSAEVPDLSRLPTVGGTMKGHASLNASGNANLGTNVVSARVHVIGGKVSYDTQTVDDVRVVATVHGALDHPVVDVGVHASGLAFGDQKVNTADIRGHVEPGAVIILRDAHVDLVREGLTVSVTARRAQFGGPSIVVEGVVVTGLGEPVLANFSRDANEVRVNLDGPSIDLRRIAVIAGKRDTVKSGTLALGGNIALRNNSINGELHATLDSFSGGQINGGNVVVDASFNGNDIGLSAKADMADAGRFTFVTRDVALSGSPLELESWKRLKGRAKFDGDVDLGRAAQLVPTSMMPFSELSGRIVLAGTIGRDNHSAPPELGIHAHTRGLIIAGKTSHEEPLDAVHGQMVSGVQPWRSEGVDGSLDARVDATSGDAEVAFHADDKTGMLVAFDAKSSLPYQRIIGDPARAMELLKSAPIRAKIVIPRRTLSSMPAVAGMTNIPGTLEAELNIGGTALEPHIDFVARGRGVRSPSLAPTTAADADVNFTYDGETGNLAATVSADKRPAVALSAHVDLRSRDLLEPKPGQPLDWGAGAKVKLTNLPLDAIGPLADRRVRGGINGEIVLEDLHKDAKLHAVINLDDVKVARAAFKGGKIVVDAHRDTLALSARIDQTDGYVELKAHTGIRWGTALAPSIDPDGKLEARLDAKAFQLAAIGPFVQSVVNGLDGRLDANAHVTVDPGLRDPTMEGKVTVKGGTLQLVALGEEFKDARATVTFLPGGRITVDDVYMRGTDGELTASAEVKTRGLSLDSATASLHIPKQKALDLSMGGQPIGEVSGDVKVAASTTTDGKTLNVKVDVPTLDVALPQKLKSGVQELAPSKENVRIGTFRDPQNFVKLPLDSEDIAPPSGDEPVGTTVDVQVNLGTITIGQGNTAKISLAGNPRIRITNKTEVTGQIQLKGGAIDVMGKKFEVEKGTVTFQPGDTSNPIIVASAAWTADDGTRIYADFVGPVKTGKLNFRSDPARPPNEIVAIILFGTSDGANAAPPPPGRAPNGTTKVATSVGGGFAAQGLTEALDDIAGLQATARIDSSRSNNPAPEIEVQLSRRVSVAFAHVLGTPPLSEPDINLVIVEWRFRRNWSLETTVGDRGKLQTDAVWTKRY